MTLFLLEFCHPDVAGELSEIERDLVSPYGQVHVAQTEKKIGADRRMEVLDDSKVRASRLDRAR